MNKISDNLEKVKAGIQKACDKANRSVEEITLVVVTKSTNLDGIKQVIKLGCTHCFGANAVA